MSSSAECVAFRYAQHRLAKDRLKWPLLIVVVASCYLHLSLFSLSGIPYFRTGDQAFFWTYAARMLSGEVFIRDFHQFTPPGTDIVYAAVFRWLGTSTSSIDWTILWLGLILVMVCYFSARSIMEPGKAALAAMLSWWFSTVIAWMRLTIGSVPFPIYLRFS